jgi:uncharacterized membrane protein YozB (DUF420 family)
MPVADLPAWNALLNGLSACLLALGYAHVRRGRREAHRRCMLGACGTSVAFLISYLTYHASVQTVTRFVEPGWFRPIYLVILLTHTLLAAVLVPLVCVTLFLAWRQRFDTHRRIARWTWPIWMYVSVTGVGIYLLLYHVFPQR